jgi:hypothetical protein
VAWDSWFSIDIPGSGFQTFDGKLATSFDFFNLPE